MPKESSKKKGKHKRVVGRSQRPTDPGAAMRHKLITAARKLFSERGYPGTSTRDLAAAAGVTERTLFRYFPAKPLMFEAAIVTPFHDAIEAYVQRWEQRPHGVNDAIGEINDLFVGLFNVLSANRGLVRALIAAQAFEADAVDTDASSGASLADLLDRLQTIMEVEAAQRGWKLDAEVTIRLLFGMLIGSTVHADWLFKRPVPGRDRMLSELAALSVYGMAGPRAQT